MEELKLYSSGFNAGYLLARYEPGLLSQILRNMSLKLPYVEGLFSGQSEFAIEINNELEQLKGIRRNGPERDERER